MKQLINVSLMTTLLLFGCKASEDFSGSSSVTIKKLKETYKDQVAFQLVNISDEPVQIESTRHFYIEKKLIDKWNRVPFVPCPCGTPCRPSSIKKLEADNSIEISWNLLSRKCNKAPGKSPVENREEKVSSGNYRMIFNVNRERNGVRIEPEKVMVNFSVQAE